EASSSWLNPARPGWLRARARFGNGPDQRNQALPCAPSVVAGSTQAPAPKPASPRHHRDCDPPRSAIPEPLERRYHRGVPGEGEAVTTDLAPPVIAVPELAAGTRLGDRYRLIARLGRGGSGTVWRAFDDKVGEELALKLIDGGADLVRWRREV